MVINEPGVPLVVQIDVSYIAIAVTLNHNGMSVAVFVRMLTPVEKFNQQWKTKLTTW